MAEQSSANRADTFSEEATDVPDVEAIMSKIRSEVKAGLSDHKPGSPKHLPPGSEQFGNSVSPILYSDELNYLNAHWNDWTTSEPITSHRRIVGPFIAKIKNKIRQYILSSVFKDYFEKERFFQMELVKYLNSVARYVDARDKELFWQIMHKVDADIQGVNERMDLLFDEKTLSIASVTEVMASGPSRVDGHSTSNAGENILSSRDSGQPFFTVSESPVLVVGVVASEFLAKQLGEGVTIVETRPDSSSSHLRGLEDGSIGGMLIGISEKNENSDYLKQLIEHASGKLRRHSKVAVSVESPDLSASEEMLSSEKVIEILENNDIEVQSLAQQTAGTSQESLRPLDIPSYTPPHLRRSLEQINKNFIRLNGKIWGVSAYGVFGELRRNFE